MITFLGLAAMHCGAILYGTANVMRCMRRSILLALRIVLSDASAANRFLVQFLRNAFIDAGGAALDCPQNVLPDVPVLPLCCPRQRLWAPEDRRMLPSHEGGKTLGCALSVIDIGKFHLSFCKQCCHTGVLVLSMAVRPWWLMCPQGTVNGVAWLVTCVKQ